MPYTLLDNLATLTSGEKLQKFIELYLSFLRLGFIPFVPGTLGTLGALPIVYYSVYAMSFSQSIILFFAITTFNYWVWSFYCKRFSPPNKDPKWMVQDEVSGILLTSIIIPKEMALSQPKYFFITIIFVLFRFFDITKVFPANYFDRKSSASAVIHDDIVSGFYAGIFAILIFKFFLS